MTEYAAIVDSMMKQAHAMFVMEGYNVKHIADFDVTGNGLYLFNHFAADDMAS
jgi:hypothetical protein